MRAGFQYGKSGKEAAIFCRLRQSGTLADSTSTEAPSFVISSRHNGASNKLKELKLKNQKVKL